MHLIRKLIFFVNFLSVFFIEIHSHLKPLPDELSSRLSLAKCVGTASSTFFEEGDILLVSLPVHEVSAFQASATVLDRLMFVELFNRSHVSLVIKKTTNFRKDEHYQKAVDNYVIQVRAVHELSENLNMLQGYISWNPHAKFLIVSVTIYEDNNLAAENIIQHLWNVKVFNAVVALPNALNLSQFDIYSWFPFSEGRCGDMFNKFQIIDSCSFGIIEKRINWFPQKVPHNLNGCPIKVRTVVWPPYVLSPEKKVEGTENQYIFTHGVEIMLMNTIAESANLSVNYTLSDTIQDWGLIDKNGTATGTLLHLIKEESDVAISSFAASIETHMFFDTIPYPIPESLKWCVPHADIYPSWKSFLTIVSTDTWCWFGFIFLIIGICLWKFSRIQKMEIPLYKHLPNCLQVTFAVLFNVSIRIQPKTNTVRLLFLVWVIFSLHFNVAYQTSLISVFAKAKYEHQISTVQEIFGKNLNLWFLPTEKRFFSNAEDWLSAKVLQNWRDCKDINECLYKTAFLKDSAVCTPTMYLTFIKDRFVTRSGDPRLYCFKNNIVTYPLEMLLRKGFPFKNYFTALIGRITSSGLMDHWKKQILFFKLESTSLVSEDDNTVQFKLTIDHLKIVFIQLGIGYVLSFLVMLLEIYVNKRKYFKEKPFKTKKKH